MMLLYLAGSGKQVVIYFESDPKEATVSIDENVVGKTPDFKSKMLASGKHQIKMEKEGFYTETKILDLKKGTSVKFTLFPPIKINSDPTGAVVQIDGKMLCESTPCEKVVDEGEREIIVQKDLYSTKKQTISVQRGNNIQIDLEPNFGWLEIESAYVGVDVVLDGKNIGKTPIQKMQITPGAHLIEPQGECFNTVQEQFVAEKGKTHTINLGVQQKKSAIKVSAKDDKGNDLEADVFVDGKRVGKVPDDNIIPIPLCSKEVEIVSSAGQKKVRLDLKAEATSEVVVVLESINRRLSDYDFNDRQNKVESEKLDNIEKEIQYKKTRQYVGVGVGFLVTGVLSFGAAGLSHYLMSTYNDDARAKFNPVDPSKSKEFVDKAKSAGMARNVLIGIGAGFSTIGIIMFFITKEQPVAVYVDEKGFMLSYNFKF